jgi:vancomycin resistance protein YoaR
MIISRKFYNILKWLLFIVAVFLIALLILFVIYISFEKKYSNNYFPGTSIAGFNVGGLERREVEQKLNQKIDVINKEGINFAYHNEQATLDILLTSTEADIALPIIMFDIDMAVETAFAYARSQSWLYNVKEQMLLSKKGRDFGIQVNVSQNELDNFLIENFSHFSTPSKDASLIATSSPTRKTVEFGVKEEVYGQVLDFDKAQSDLKNKLSQLDNSVIFLEATIEYPQIYKKDCFNIESKAKDIIELAPINLLLNDSSWQLDHENLLSLMTLKKGDKDDSSQNVYVGLNMDKTVIFLDTSIATSVNQEAIDAKFEIVDGKVEKFQINKDGVELDIPLSFDILEKSLLSKETEKIELVTKIIKSKNANEEMANLGIKEIIGTGHSDFSRSPYNRRHNIAIGAASVNGTLIAPDEEFSLLKVLGTIDGSSGYKQELVIKEGKTIPEYGGGLCQIGTTVFRGTVQSGLPVTMRRNHSYRVSYYEPAGTDATIYDPWPDYKFKNDTGKHVLIQSRIEGNDLYFDFWGTKDGRVATSTYPVIYNIKRPGPTKMIETLDLGPGVKKCTEHAHNGADAYFDYKVTYPDGEEKEERFKSHYVPWQAVCLIGVEELTVDKEKKEALASSTESIKN